MELLSVTYIDHNVGPWLTLEKKQAKKKRKEYPPPKTRSIGIEPVISEHAVNILQLHFVNIVHISC